MGRTITDPTADAVLRHEDHTTRRPGCVLCAGLRPRRRVNRAPARRIALPDLKAAGWRVVKMQNTGPGRWDVDIVREGERRRARNVAWS